MEPILLVNDLQSCNCDSKIAFPDDALLQEQYAHLDGFAKRVSAFHDNLAPKIKTIFAIQETEEDNNTVRPLTDAEKKLHIIMPKKHDHILVKNTFSAVQEHAYVFEDLKKNKKDVLILTGVWAGRCILENAEDLLDMKFKVVLPMDLITNPEEGRTFDAFAHLAHNPNLIFTDSAHALQDAYHLLGRVPKPERVFPKGLRETLAFSAYGL